MGFRFRKSVSFGPLRLNASKSGLGWSVGVPGARYTQMANGRKRVTASIPGTGISWVEESKKRPEPIKYVPEEEKTENLTGWPLFWHIVWEVTKVLFWIAVGCLAIFVFFIIPIMEAANKGK